MRQLAPVFAILFSAAVAHAAGPTVLFTTPPENTTPSTFGSLPFPCDLYFDQGRPGDGDGTLLNTGASMGLGVAVVEANTATIEDAYDLMDGFGTTTGTYFFLSGAVDAASLPPSPRLTPSLSDSVFCAEAATGTPVPIELKFDADSRIANVLAVVPVPGRPLKPKTTYTCVVRTSVTGGSAAVEPSADFVDVRGGTSANGDANAIFAPVLAVLAGQGVAAADIAGMTVFTTESTTDDLLRIRDVVLPGLPVPSADFTSRPELVFDTATEVDALLGTTPHAHVGKVATGFYPSARFQTHDPDGDGFLGDFPLPPSFVTCAGGGTCETTDERFTRDGFGNPIVIDTPKIPFTIVVPSGAAPAGGWPIVIQQHGLGGQRDTVIAFAEQDAARGFASIGIDAASHGYRYFNCTPSAPCAQDVKNFVGGTAVPDGFIDNDFSLAGFGPGFLSVNLGFFQGFHNFLGVRDNFRQTYADLLSLVRLIQGHSIDGALGAPLDDARVFYMGHSLGGLMGSGFVPMSPDVKAALLNATGGGLVARLFLNSSIGAGALGLVNGVLGLDPANSVDQFAFLANLVQAIVDPADGINAASLLLDPGPGGGAPRNVIQVEDFGDQVVPNPSNEAAAVAAGLPLFVPYVQNLNQNPNVLALANAGTPGTVHGNAAAGAATAVLLQNGPATHAASVTTVPGDLTYVPGFAHWDEFGDTGQAFPTLARTVRVPNAGILPNVLDWFADVVAHGTPGTFTFTTPPNFNPVENAEVPAGASTHTFFARTVSAGSPAAASEPTGNVTLDLVANGVESRVTAGRSILGTEQLAAAADLPPGEGTALVPLGPSLPALGFLPFFVSLQREIPAVFSANLTIAYSTAELEIAGIVPGSADESALVIARFDGSSYVPQPSTVNVAGHAVSTTAPTSDLGTFVVVHADALTGGFLPPLVPGGGAAMIDCRLEWVVVNASNSPFLDTRGRVNAIQTCHDGDPLCDADRTADGTCSFRVAACFHVNASGCPAEAVTAFALRTPKTTSRNGTDAANAVAVLGAVHGLGGTLAGDAITFSPGLATEQCSASVAVEVPVGAGRPGSRNLRARARGASGYDSDRLKLRCAS